MPDSVIAILENDLEQQRKKRLRNLQIQNTSEEQLNRIDEHKLALITKEFTDKWGRERDIKSIDSVLKHLKFLKKFTDEERHLIFRKADYRKIEA